MGRAGALTTVCRKKTGRELHKEHGETGRHDRSAFVESAPDAVRMHRKVGEDVHKNIGFLCHSLFFFVPLHTLGERLFPYSGMHRHERKDNHNL